MSSIEKYKKPEILNIDELKKEIEEHKKIIVQHQSLMADKIAIINAYERINRDEKSFENTNEQLSISALQTVHNIMEDRSHAITVGNLVEVYCHHKRIDKIKGRGAVYNALHYLKKKKIIYEFNGLLYLKEWVNENGEPITAHTPTY